MRSIDFTNLCKIQFKGEKEVIQNPTKNKFICILHPSGEKLVVAFITQTELKN